MGVLEQELTAQGAVGIRATKQNTIWHDDGGSATFLEEVDHEPNEEQLALGGDGGFAFALAGETLAVLAEVALIHAAGEGRVGEDVVIGAAFVVRQSLAECVELVDFGRFQIVEDEVHPRDADHGAVVVVAVEEATEIVLLTFGPHGQDIVRRAVPFEAEHVGVGAVGFPLQQGVEQEAAGAAGGIEDGFA